MAFIREVDEAFREDELKRYFHLYGRWVLLLVGIGLLAFGGWLWWQAENTRKAEALSEQFSAVLAQMDSGATADALGTLAEIRQSSNVSYRTLAAFTEAGIALADADNEKAATLFEEVANDPKAPQALREAATLRHVKSRFDVLEPKAILERLQPFLAGDSLWFPVAGEMAAMAHLRAGDNNDAAALFVRVASDDRAPASLRARAEQMAAFLGQDVTGLVEKREAEMAALAEGATDTDEALASSVEGAAQ